MIRPLASPCVRGPFLLCLLLGGGGAFAGTKAETVHRLVADGSVDVAQKKCDKWEAATVTDDPSLRDACAKAFWRAAELEDRVQTWREYGERWKGTDWAANARVREAAVALEEVEPEESESSLLSLADRYAGTPSAPSFAEKAADAAVRDAKDGDAASAAAARYPAHRGLPGLVERFPEAFLRVGMSASAIDVSIEPPVALTGELAPVVAWVAREADGEVRGWDQSMRDALLDWGVPAPWLSARLAAHDPAAGPLFRLCQIPNQATGWTPGVEVRVGRGAIFRPVGFDEQCGAKTWPVFLTVAGGTVASISLRPGHRVDAHSSRRPTGERHAGHWLGPASGATVLREAALWVRAGRGFLVSPLSGGMPWASNAGPGDIGITLDGAIRGGALPEGWRLQQGDAGIRVENPALAKMPAHSRNWVLMPGDVRVVPGFVQQALGLAAGQSKPPRPAAPSLSGGVNWSRSADGSVRSHPPLGAKMAGMYLAEAADQQGTLAVLQTLGLGADRVEVLDAWKCDLDQDKVAETVLRTRIDGEGVLVVADPMTGKTVAGNVPTRVFLIEAPGVMADTALAGQPFSFRIGQFVYLAWGRSLVAGTDALVHQVQVLRFDGTGFTLEAHTLP